MTMQMRRAFNARMQTRVILHKIAEGSYDSNNDWTEGERTDVHIFAVVTAGNKFSQFEEGIALDAQDGGARYSDYRNMYAMNKYEVAIGDKLTFRDTFYRVLQKSDEQVYGFSSYIIEKSEDGE